MVLDADGVFFFFAVAVGVELPESELWSLLWVVVLVPFFLLTWGVFEDIWPAVLSVSASLSFVIASLSCVSWITVVWGVGGDGWGAAGREGCGLRHSDRIFNALTESGLYQL